MMAQSRQWGAIIQSSANEAVATHVQFSRAPLMTEGRFSLRLVRARVLQTQLLTRRAARRQAAVELVSTLSHLGQI